MSATASDTMNELVMVCKDLVEMTATTTSKLPSRVKIEINDKRTETLVLKKMDWKMSKS